MIQSDWIKLLVKFNGKCSVCGQLIKSGNYAFWSKTSKSIKHLDCQTQDNPTLGNHNTTKSPPQDKCFLCKKLGLLFINSSHDLEKDDTNLFFICNNCINNPRCYTKYQELMLEKMIRIVKLKS